MLTGSCHCGAVYWTFDGDPGTATTCNCTVCRRYGTIWAYDWDGERIKTTGETACYLRSDIDVHLGFHFCANCGCNTWWRSTARDAEGRTRIAVNLRLIDDPDMIQNIPIRHFDGLETFKDNVRDNRCVRDHWY